MLRSLTAAIAWRYLRKEKTRGTVGTISTVSVCAMAIATAAIICVLSVFNGFKEIIGSRLDTLAPQVKVTPARGKVFSDADSLIRVLSGIPGVELATPTLSDNALVIANGQEMPVTIKGILPDQYARVTAIRDLIGEDYGEYFNPDKTVQGINGDADKVNHPSSVVSVGVASRMKVVPGDRLLIFAPKRHGRVNMANPLASFISDSLSVTGVYRSDQQQYDEDGMLAPIETVRRLFEYDTEASAVEIKAAPGTEPAELAGKIRERLGSRFIVQDQLQQQELNFRMIAIEKWVSFLLLAFILVIASFNCISSLSMVVIEKEKALSTFTALGMSRVRIGRIFAWESIFVSMSGGIAGIITGVVLCLLQQRFGFIKLGVDAGASVISSYPVRLVWTDILITLVPVTAIGLVTAYVTARFARSRISTAG